MFSKNKLRFKNLLFNRVSTPPSKISIIKILGIPAAQVTMEQTMLCIEEFVNSGESHLIVTLGAEMVMAARKKHELREMLKKASLIVPDGGGILWAAKKLGDPLKEKVAGIELIEKISSQSGRKNWNLFFLGGKPGISEKAVQKLRNKFPDMKIVGSYHGYFNHKEIPPILKNEKIDILFVGMGFPYQENWILNHCQALQIPVGIGVGGSFDVLSGELKRAPKWMINLNLEWFYRLIQEPRRWKRMLVIPQFMILVYALSIKKLFSDKTEEEKENRIT